MPRGNPHYSYVPKFTDDMQKQIDATVFLISKHVAPEPLDGIQQKYVQDHLKNLVETCLSIATVPLQQQRKAK